jgi:hypothetical protein
MANLTERVDFVDKDKLPEELAGFDGLGLNDRHELVGFDQEGNTKRVGRVGELIIKLAKETGIAEEATAEDISPAAQAIIDRLEQQNRLQQAQITVLEQDKATRELRLAEYDQKFEGLEGEINSLRRQIVDRDRQVDGFWIGDAVAELVDNDGETEDYARRYEVVGFSEENADGILIKDLDSNETHESPSENLILEEELEDEESDIIVPGDILTYTTSTGALEPGWVATSGIWSDREGVEFVTARSPSGAERHLRYEEISIGDDLPPPPPADTPGQRPGRFNRFLMTPNMAIGRGMTNLMTRRSETVTEYDEAGRPVNEVVYGGGIGALGGAALAGAGVLVGYLIWGRHGGHNYGPDIASLRLHEKQNQAAILAHARADKVNDAAQIKAAIAANNKADRVKDAAQIKAAVAAQERAEEAQGASGGLQGGSVGHNGNSLHTYYYDGDPGHRKTGLKSNVLRLLGRPGHKYLVDNNGHVVLNHVQWDQQRKLSVLDRARLKSKGFNLGTGLLSRGYTTIITRD